MKHPSDMSTPRIELCGLICYQLGPRGAHPFGRTRAINTVQSSVYSHSEFSPKVLVIMEDVNVESKVESGEGEMGPGQHVWPCLSTMF